MRALASVATFIVALGIGSEGALSQDAAAQARWDAAKASCNAKIKNGQFGSFQQETACFARAEVEYMQTIRFPWMELEYRNQTKHLDIAAAMDAESVTAERGYEEMAEADREMADEINRRTDAIQRAQGQADAAADAQRRAALLGIASQLLAPRPAAPPVVQVAPMQTFCQPVAGGVQCNSQ